MNIPITPKDNQSESAYANNAFFELAFRPFFLLASLFSIIALIIWGGYLQGHVNVNLYGGALWWHTHEMLFAFITAIIVGFLLTAVQNWTSVRSVNGKGLMLLVGLWLLARCAFLMPDILNLWIIASLDVVFLPLSAIILAYPIIKVKLWRNLMFIPILLIMALCNAVMHYSVLFQDASVIKTASTTMVLLVTLVMCIMGGRVFPMFTANGTKTKRVDALPWLEKLTIISTLLVVIVYAGLISLPIEVIAALFFVSGVANGCRAFRWKFKVTLGTPLLWSLHLSYWAIALGLIMFGIAMLSPIISHSQAIHTLTIGGMGGMILSMISRVSLGHTGRNLVVGKIMTMAFIAIVLAFIVRVFGSYILDDYQHVIAIAILFWVIAYGSFVALYAPILSKPRV